MDETDQLLLRLLRADGRASYTSLADEVGASEATVRARVRRLVEDGTIRRFTIRTGGQHVKALVEVGLESKVHAADVTKRIASWEGVEAVWEVTGDDDIVVVADCNDPGALNELIDRIRDVPGTRTTRSRLILTEY